MLLSLRNDLPIDMIQSRDIMSFLYSKHEKAYYVIEPPYYVIYLIRKIRTFMECFLENDSIF